MRTLTRLAILTRAPLAILLKRVINRPNRTGADAMTKKTCLLVTVGLLFPSLAGAADLEKVSPSVSQHRRPVAVRALDAKTAVVANRRSGTLSVIDVVAKPHPHRPACSPSWPLGSPVRSGGRQTPRSGARPSRRPRSNGSAWSTRRVQPTSWTPSVVT